MGFTGTTVWADPVQDLGVVLLTNRVHPSREGDGIKRLRPEFHDAVAEAVLGI
jgi:CubicO group peptidase (beta-lactamase class C family)